MENLQMLLRGSGVVDYTAWTDGGPAQGEILWRTVRALVAGESSRNMEKLISPHSSDLSFCCLKGTEM
ncbi:unnamed protein product [Gongylonema pulchrum]|uniref:Uncharacterized protein n=1 Tax=Gongylonema pulchrum TaxID=637853 RepID=A0A183DDU2_9BILA|nr:unnamed protein product [Gongylonema pulchrum]